MIDRSFQFLIWGYAIEGDVVEHDALLAEGAAVHRTPWDFTRAEMSSCMLDNGDGFEPVPDWWGLRCLPFEWRSDLLAEGRRLSTPRTRAGVGQP